MEDAKKYYTGLRFARPHSARHMTLAHRGVLTPLSLASHIQRVDEQFRVALEEGAAQFALTLSVRALFGPRRDIPVLRPNHELPLWLTHLTRRGWQPHVTTAEERLDLTAVAVAVMHKDQEICRWQLPTTT